MEFRNSIHLQDACSARSQVKTGETRTQKPQACFTPSSLARQRSNHKLRHPTAQPTPWPTRFNSRRPWVVVKCCNAGCCSRPRSPLKCLEPCAESTRTAGPGTQAQLLADFTTYTNAVEQEKPHDQAFHPATTEPSRRIKANAEERRLEA